MPPPEYTWAENKKHSRPQTYGDMRNMELNLDAIYGGWDTFTDWCFMGMLAALALVGAAVLWMGWYAFLLEAVAGLPDTQEVRDMIPQLAVMTTVVAVVIATVAICITYYRINKLDNAHEKSMKQMELDHDLQIYLARMQVIDRHNGVITVEQLIEVEMGTLAGDAAERRGQQLIAAVNNANNVTRTLKNKRDS